MQNEIKNQTEKHETGHKLKVIDSFWTFLVATAFFGPFALPLLWRNPRYSKKIKIVGSVAVLLFTVGLIVFTKRTLEPLINEASSLMENN